MIAKTKKKTNGKKSSGELTPEQQDAISKELRQIYNKTKSLHTTPIWKAARNPNSSMHDFFTWNVAEAAEKCWDMEARQLIARVKIVVPVSDTEVIQVRAYHAIRSNRSGYKHTEDILQSSQLRESLLAQLANDLERLQSRYDVIADLMHTKDLFRVIEEFCKRRVA